MEGQDKQAVADLQERRRPRRRSWWYMVQIDVKRWLHRRTMLLLRDNCGLNSLCEDRYIKLTRLGAHRILIHYARLMQCLYYNILINEVGMKSWEEYTEQDREEVRALIDNIVELCRSRRTTWFANVDDVSSVGSSSTTTLAAGAPCGVAFLNGEDLLVVRAFTRLATSPSYKAAQPWPEPTQRFIVVGERMIEALVESGGHALGRDMMFNFIAISHIPFGETMGPKTSLAQALPLERRRESYESTCGMPLARRPFRTPPHMLTQSHSRSLTVQSISTTHHHKIHNADESCGLHTACWSLGQRETLKILARNFWRFPLWEKTSYDS
uniref:Uncharacterized protein n=1 Tax=Oryza barthii TaxID=65489 RepID=A0A0D3F7W1_9ORYZ